MTSADTLDVATATERLDEVRSRIADAAKAMKRDPGGGQLIAVGKTFGAERIVPVIEAGQRIFGENRVQESLGKWPELKERYPDVELHLIGPLQSNKAKEAVGLFDVIQTVDRPKIAAALAREMKRQDRHPRLLIQVNTGEEPQKAGVMPRDTGDFVEWCRAEHALAIHGLMCIPPIDEEAALHFALLAKIAGALGLDALSMGMSADFETAVAFGATYVRVGTAIFGKRG